MPVHQIRLRGPWEISLIDGVHSRITLPIAGNSFAKAWPDSAMLQRAFHRPTNLDHESVLLVLENLPGPGKVALNDTSLGCWDTGALTLRFPITPLLKQRNLIRLELTSIPSQAFESSDSWLNVSLEIVSA